MREKLRKIARFLITIPYKRKALGEKRRRRKIVIKNRAIFNNNFSIPYKRKALREKRCRRNIVIRNIAFFNNHFLIPYKRKAPHRKQSTAGRKKFQLQLRCNCRIVIKKLSN